MADTPEGKVKKKTKQWFDKHGAYWYMVVPSGYSRVGVPDFVACMPMTVRALRTWIASMDDDELLGLFMGVETKAPGKRSNTSVPQKRELKKIHDAGGIDIVIDDVEQLDALFLGGILHDRQQGEEATHSQPA